MRIYFAMTSAFSVFQNQTILFGNNLDQTYSMAQFIEWSRRQDDDQARPLFVVQSKFTHIVCNTIRMVHQR